MIYKVLDGFRLSPSLDCGFVKCQFIPNLKFPSLHTPEKEILRRGKSYKEFEIVGARG
jgi:hypothetical protein